MLINVHDCILAERIRRGLLPMLPILPAHATHTIATEREALYLFLYLCVTPPSPRPPLSLLFHSHSLAQTLHLPFSLSRSYGARSHIHRRWRLRRGLKIKWAQSCGRRWTSSTPTRTARSPVTSSRFMAPRCHISYTRTYTLRV
jgi:hypothetical protein